MIVAILLGLLVGLGILLTVTGCIEWCRNSGPWGLNALFHWLLASACFAVTVMVLVVMHATAWVMS